MQDFDELKKLKAQCIADIREALPLYANRLNSIDERLMTYIEDAISNEGSHSRSTSGRLLPARPLATVRTQERDARRFSSTARRGKSTSTF